MRAVRAEAPTQRRLYATEWRAIDLGVLGGAAVAVLAIGGGESTGCERLSPRVSHEELAARLAEATAGEKVLAEVAMETAVEGTSNWNSKRAPKSVAGKGAG